MSAFATPLYSFVSNTNTDLTHTKKSYTENVNNTNLYFKNKKFHDCNCVCCTIIGVIIRMLDLREINGLALAH